MDKELTYKGVPIEQLTREDLLTLCRWYAQALEKEREAHNETLEMERLFADTRKALGFNVG